MDSRTSPARRYLVAMIVALAVGSVFNLVWETSAPNSEAAMRRAGGSRLIDLARAEKSSLPGKVGFALSLRTVATGGVLIVPDDAIVEVRQIEFLSAMTIRVENYDARVDQDVRDSLSSAQRIEGLGKIHFNDERPSSYVIAWLPDGEPVDVMRLYWDPSDLIIVLDERIVMESDQ